MIRAVFFDAVGTLIEPAPPAAEVYLSVGRKHGSRLGLDAIGSRFLAAFRAEDDRDRTAAWRTDEQREELRWRSIVANVLDDVTDGEACFRELWGHFAQPQAWRCLDGAAEMLGELNQRGLQLGMASNFDSRLRAVVSGIDALKPVWSFVISSEIGWRKPAQGFFEHVVRTARLPPAEILFVGDDPVNDDEGARAAGLHVLLLDHPGDRAWRWPIMDLMERLS
jgi:putative hydrolase of the HAD superfamily